MKKSSSRRARSRGSGQSRRARQLEAWLALVEADGFAVEVGDPREATDAGVLYSTTFTTYAVRTSFAPAGGAGGALEVKLEVRRRYTDFEMLRASLARRYPACSCPRSFHGVHARRGRRRAPRVRARAHAAARALPRALRALPRIGLRADATLHVFTSLNTCGWELLKKRSDDGTLNALLRAARRGRVGRTAAAAAPTAPLATASATAARRSPSRTRERGLSAHLAASANDGGAGGDRGGKHAGLCDLRGEPVAFPCEGERRRVDALAAARVPADAATRVGELRDEAGAAARARRRSRRGRERGGRGRRDAPRGARRAARRARRLAARRARRRAAPARPLPRPSRRRRRFAGGRASAASRSRARARRLGAAPNSRARSPTRACSSRRSRPRATRATHRAAPSARTPRQRARAELEIGRGERRGRAAVGGRARRGVERSARARAREERDRLARRERRERERRERLARRETPARAPVSL